MNCSQCPIISCSNGTNTTKRTIIRHPQGNYIQISIPLKRIITTVIDGVEETFVRDPAIKSKGIKAVLSRDKKTYPFDVTIQNDMVVFSDNGTLPLGTYDISVKIEWGEIRGFYKRKAILQIIDETANGGEYENDEFNVTAIYPKVEGRTSAIIIDDDEVIISEAGKFAGDDTPNDNYADVTAQYGDSSISIDEDFVTLKI